MPWLLIPPVIDETGDLDGRVLIDTTNQFGPGGLQAIPDGLTAAQFNQQRVPTCRLIKACNTLTPGFQAAEAGRPAAERVVLFMCGDDPDAKIVAAGLIEDVGFTPVDGGGFGRRDPDGGALYDEGTRRDASARSNCSTSSSSTSTDKADSITFSITARHHF